jgi:hypothetical protein
LFRELIAQIDAEIKTAKRKGKAGLIIPSRSFTGFLFWDSLGFKAGVSPAKLLKRCEAIIF